MIIHADTTIAAIIAHNQKALEVIVSISKKFEKLRNPLLRRLIAPRTSVAAACRMGGCFLEDFFAPLEALGFEIDRKEKSHKEAVEMRPAFLVHLKKEDLEVLDVRPCLASGGDPLALVMKAVKKLRPEGVLKIINSFEPTPLLHLLERKGFETYVETLGPEHVSSYCYRSPSFPGQPSTGHRADMDLFEEAGKRFKGKTIEIDVRQLDMPQPMYTILEALGSLPEGKALAVAHRRIPVLLLEALTEKNFEYQIKEISEGEVRLLIYRD